MGATILERCVGLRFWAAALTVVIIFVVGLAQPPLLTQSPGSPIGIPGGPGNVAVGDVNQDGKPDLMVASGQARSVAVLLGRGDGRFDPAPGSPLRVPDGPSEMALGDVSGDGNLDLVLASHGSYGVMLLIGDGQGAFTLSPNSPVAMKDGGHPHTHGLAIGDVNGDGRLDLVSANHDDNDVAVMLGDGRGGFVRAPASPFAVGAAPYPIALADIDGDGHIDIAAPNVLAGTVAVLLGDGKGRFGPAPRSPFAVAARPYYVSLGDLNGDGRPDLVATHDDASLTTVMLNEGSGGFRPAPGSPFDLGRRAFAALFSDVDGDRKMDLVAATNDSATVLLGDGRGGLTPAPGSPFPTGRGTWRLAVGDVNGDGRADIATSNLESNSVSVLLGR
jgi:hypothetical protein